MNKLKVKIVNDSGFELPSYSTIMSAGMDLKASLGEEMSISLGEGCRILIPTKLKISLPEGYEAQIRPRSGLALKQGITVLNSPGTIDADYRGEIGVIVINHGDSPVIINHGDRICQMVISKHEVVEWEEASDLEDTERGSGGFGHTGKK